MHAVFELVDVTDEEMYYPLGVFASLCEAIATVESNKEPWQLSEQSFDCDAARLEIRERKLGLSGPGRKVWKREWTRDFDVEDQDSPQAWRQTVPEPARVGRV